MSQETYPKTFKAVRERHKKLIEALDELGKAAKNEGPIVEKNAQLIQLAAAASIHSEGAVHSHVRRALAAGATPEEIYHAIVLLTSTIGFPTVVAALNWADDVIGKEPA